MVLLLGKVAAPPSQAACGVSFCSHSGLLQGALGGLPYFGTLLLEPRALFLSPLGSPQVSWGSAVLPTITLIVALLGRASSHSLTKVKPSYPLIPLPPTSLANACLLWECVFGGF